MFLGINILGHAVCFGGCLLGFAIHQFAWKLPRCDAEPTYEDAVTGARKPRRGYEGVANDGGKPAPVSATTIEIVAAAEVASA